MGIWIGGHKSEGPYGFLCLGLSYDWDNEKKILTLKRLILVKVDIKLRVCIEPPLYYDMFEYENEITEKDGRHYYLGCPILNYDMFEMPEQLDEVIEKKDRFGLEEGWMYINTKGRTKYSVNRVCNWQTSFRETYMELYACVLDFDERTLSGCLVGFDCLGKILNRSFDLNGLSGIHDVHQALLEDMVIFDLERDKEIEDRKEECGILNLDCYLDENDRITYEYRSIWE